MNKADLSLAALFQWYAKRLLRERILLVCCCAVILYLVWDTLILAPVEQRRQALSVENSLIERELSELETLAATALLRKDFDPDRDNRLRLVSLQEESAKLQQQFQADITDLVSPQEMPGLLKKLLLKQQKLKLVSLQNLPAEPLPIAQRVIEGVPTSVLYRHRLQIVVSGDYLATLAYLQQLEDLPRRLIWEVVEIETQQYPQAEIHLQIYTLSLEKGWISG